MAARFPRGKQPECPVHCIGTRKRSNLIYMRPKRQSLGRQFLGWIKTFLNRLKLLSSILLLFIFCVRRPTPSVYLHNFTCRVEWVLPTLLFNRSRKLKTAAMLILKVPRYSTQTPLASHIRAYQIQSCLHVFQTLSLALLCPISLTYY